MVARPSRFLPPSTSTAVVLWLWGLVIVPSSLTLASPGTCYQVELYPRQLLDAMIMNCAIDRSICSGDTQCNCNDGTGSGTLAEAKCLDGCVYALNNQIRPIVRQTLAGEHQVGSVGGSSPFYARTFGLQHAFLPNADGSVDGLMEYYYEPNIQNIRAPAAGRDCSAFLDGQACSCYQRYCNEDQTIFGNVIDCSGLDGGGIIDLCVPPPPITEASSKAEILFWVPQLLCEDLSSLPTFEIVNPVDQQQPPPASDVFPAVDNSIEASTSSSGSPRRNLIATGAGLVGASLAIAIF